MDSLKKQQDANIDETEFKGSKLERALKTPEKTGLDLEEIGTIMMNMINRKRFDYGLRDIIAYLLRCLCLRKTKFKRYKGTREEWDMKIRKHYQFKEGEDKLFDELDVITLLKTMRRVKLLSQTLLT